ncbi:MAG TPA: Hsp20/alpha crystallin family protein [Pyrinomonadaceae bacterium]|nr:Hsp20/alpha crystallin family protein [Pyrinomonadaceae bacterium]
MPRHTWEPMRDLMTLQDRMNRLFEDAAARRDRTEEEEDEIERADWIPAADVYEAEGEFVIVLDLPGVERGGLDVGLDENRLTIRGERPRAESEGSTPRRAERPAGRFVRSFTLPETVERESITADYKDGVLRLRLPKRRERQPRRVEIKVQ